MTNEEAIAIFKWVLESPRNRCISDKSQTECLPLAIIALREQAERDKGCEYCKRTIYTVEPSGGFRDNLLVINKQFCERCGRRLEAQHE